MTAKAPHMHFPWGRCDTSGNQIVTTEECDADIRYKEAYLNAGKEDIVIVKSPVGMPGRAILNPFMKK